MQIVPVLDVRQGQAVTGQGGMRAHYRPVASRLQPGTSDPRRLAAVYRDRLGLDQLYVADLDALAGHPPDLALHRDLAGGGVDLWVDAGLVDAGGAEALIGAGVTRLVAGLETLSGPQALAGLVDRIGPDRLVFSLDLRGGQPLHPATGPWPEAARDVADLAIAVGVRRILLLDLARVGTGAGVGTDDLLARGRAAHPSVAWSVGGGVAGLADLIRLERLGASAVLVASALHDGRIGRAELAALRPGPGRRRP